ncbi:hypothetical protein PLICRDRAFT_34492 [Plicaturopsis crispa FD-325 SS-3]|nr:hypothetical protein PLICRDRAFT_34492 [Plicaturopsis crispa FD-325 SS-3]
MSNSKADIAYHALSVDLDEADYPARAPGGSSREARALRIFIATTVLSVLLNAVFLYQWISSPDKSAFKQILYSPAQSAVEYKAVKFHSSWAPDLAIYEQPPSDEVDNAWNDLYKYAISRVPKSEAARLPNKTYPVENEKDKYFVGLDVFHQLHCLNYLREALYPDYYPPPEPFTSNTTGATTAAEYAHLEKHRVGHIPHCLGVVRQALMCYSDISTVVWQWDEQIQRVMNRVDVMHTCRDFSKIHDWARDNRLDHLVDLHKHVEDDLDVPVF